MVIIVLETTSVHRNFMNSLDNQQHLAPVAKWLYTTKGLVGKLFTTQMKITSQEPMLNLNIVAQVFGRQKYADTWNPLASPDLFRLVDSRFNERFLSLWIKKAASREWSPRFFFCLPPYILTDTP